MNDEVCREKHKQINEKLELHEKRLNDHAKRLDILSEDGREYKIQIQNLCKQVENLVVTMKWFIGIWVTSLLGFFFNFIYKIL